VELHVTRAGPFVLAIDQGTTGTAAFVFDAESRIRGHADQEFPQLFPQPGWVEHDAETIWRTTQTVIAGALKQARLTAGELTAIGITNQRETTVLWDRRTGKPLANAIVWQDRRTAPLCDDLRRKGHEPLLRERTGLVADAYFSATKMKWLLENVPGAREACERGEAVFGTIDTWLIHKLTGGAVHATDATNASRTLLYDINKGQWDDELLALFGVPRAALPEVKDSSGPFGTAAKSVLGAEVPILGVAGDQQAALFGQACFEEGMAKNTYGTGAFCLMNTGERRVKTDRLITTVAWQMGGRRTYALEGSIFVSGAAVQWLRDGLGLLENASQTEGLSESVPDTGGVYFVPALTGLGAPHWDSYARGTLFGLTRGTTRAHLARATLEAIAYQVLDVVEAMAAESRIRAPVLRVDGGGSANRWLMQFQADMLQAPVERAAVQETTALGAAYLAGLAAGVWKSTDDIATAWRSDARWDPLMAQRERDRHRDGWERAVALAREWGQASR